MINIIEIIKQKFFNKNTNKLEKLTESDIQSAILALEERAFNLAKEVEEKEKEIDVCKEKYKNSTIEAVKNFHIKQAESLLVEIEERTKMLSFLAYNSDLLGKLKQAINERDFYQSTSELTSLMNDQAALSKFLINALETKKEAENNAITTKQIFDEVKNADTPNEEIYGMSSNQSSLAAQWAAEEEMEKEAQRLESAKIASSNKDVKSEKRDN